jgi:hypothetical protein
MIHLSGEVLSAVVAGDDLPALLHSNRVAANGTAFGTLRYAGFLGHLRFSRSKVGSLIDQQRATPG